jgi:hypothetical protein
MCVCVCVCVLECSARFLLCLSGYILLVRFPATWPVQADGRNMGFELLSKFGDSETQGGTVGCFSSGRGRGTENCSLTPAVGFNPRCTPAARGANQEAFVGPGVHARGDGVVAAAVLAPLVMMPFPL